MIGDKIMKVLKLGSKGSDISALQQSLSPKYYRGKIDGDYGPLTEAAVRAFQTTEFATGVFDERTSIALETAKETGPKFTDAPVSVPSTRGQLVRIFGDIKYVNTEGGQIKITNDWAKKNMVKAELPIVGKRWVHRKLEDYFATALRLIELEGFGGEITQFGTWSPRHILHNPKKPLSLHSWGIACDINWFENHYKGESKLHPIVVNAFKSIGFTWGGDWRTKDPMHFQYYK